MTRTSLVLCALAACVPCVSLLTQPANGSWAKKGGPSPAGSGDFVSKLFESFQDENDGAAGGMQEMLKKLMLNKDDGEDDSFAKAFENLPDLAGMMKEFGGGKDLEGLMEGLGGGQGLAGMMKGFGGGEGLGPLSSSPGVQALAEKFINESGEDGGLLRHFKDLKNMSDGPMDLDKLASTFRGLSDALKSRGADINSLMKEFLDGPLNNMVEPISPPEGLKHLYRKGASQPIDDAHAADLVRPEPVSLAAIRGSIGTFTEQLPAAIPGAKCHALVLSGAGARAPLQAGAILGLAEQYKAREKPLKWDVIAGVNKAAISATASLGFSPGENGEIDWARFLWDFWHRADLERFIQCPEGIKDLLNLPRILQWLVDAQAAVSGGGDPMHLGLPHSCETAVAAETLLQMLQELPQPNAAPAAKGRVAVVTATKVGGGKAVWELRGVGSEETCLVPSVNVLSKSNTCPWEEGEAPSLIPETELDLTVQLLLATNATPGLTPLTRYWGPPGPQGPHDHQGRERQGRGPYERRAGYADGRLVGNISAGEAIRACQKKLKKEGHLEDRDVEKGKGIVVDIIGTLPLEESEVEDQLVAIAEKLKILKETPRGKRLTLSSPKKLIQKIHGVYPLVTIRHLLFPEEHFNLLTDNADFRSSRALLQHGRLMGWRATTAEDLE